MAPDFLTGQLAPVGDLSGVDSLDLLKCHGADGVGGMNHRSDTVVSDGQLIQTKTFLFGLQVAAGHAEFAGALVGGLDAVGGTGAVGIDGNLRVQLGVALTQKLHKRIDGGGSGHLDGVGLSHITFAAAVGDHGKNGQNGQNDENQCFLHKKCLLWTWTRSLPSV
jgi:hypothetical protein